MTQEELLPLLQKAVKARLEDWAAMRAIELAAGQDSDTLDDFINNEAMALAVAGDADRYVTLATAGCCLKQCFGPAVGKEGR